MILEVLLVGAKLGNLVICLLVHGRTLWEDEGHLQTKAGPELILTLLEVLKSTVRVNCAIYGNIYHPRLIHQALNHSPENVLDLCIQHLFLHVQDFITYCPNTLEEYLKF